MTDGEIGRQIDIEKWGNAWGMNIVNVDRRTDRRWEDTFLLYFHFMLGCFACSLGHVDGHGVKST